MTQRDTVIIMPGPNVAEVPLLRTVAADFGWNTFVACDWEELSQARETQSAVAVVFGIGALGGEEPAIETVRRLKAALPEARLILCHGFSDHIDWPLLSRAGAYNGLWLPLKEAELRPCFGFLAEAEKRPAENILQMEHRPPKVNLMSRTAS